MRDARRRLEPLDVELELAKARGRAAERMDRGAHVVVKARQRQLVCPRTAADALLRLVHDDVEPGACKRDRPCEAVRPGPDDDRATRQAAPARVRPRAGTSVPPRHCCTTRRAASV